MARQGLFIAEETALFSRLRDWEGTGIEFVSMKTGPGVAPGTLLCVSPAIGRFADLDARTDLKGINGARAFMTDIGTYGSFWIAQGGVWFPAEPIRCTGTPEAAIAAPIGSLAVRFDGGASTTLYVKQSGTGNTGWVAK